jgi:hypothetical protein
VVRDDIDSVAVAKIRVESVPHPDLNTSCKPQVVVSRQTAYDLPSWLSWSRVQPCIPPVAKEYLSKTPVLIQPEVVAISTVLLFWRLGSPRRPFAPTVEQVAQEEYGIRIQNGLQTGVCAAQVQIGILVCKRIDRPWSARVCMRVYKLRICNEDESVGVCAGFLDPVLVLSPWTIHS